MKKSLILSIVFLFLILSTRNSFAAQINSNGSGGGVWGEKSSWDTNVPGCGDTITILSGDVITIANHQDYEACGDPLFLTISGTLDFNTNGKKLFFPCGSGVTINIGSCILSSAVGGGSDNQFDICDNQIWKTSDGPTCGFKTFGDPLPVKLLSFKAQTDDSSVKLTWTTASEINNAFFTVEKSENGIDFETVTEILGSGNSEIFQEYTTYDKTPLNGISYYRLSQTDFDGSTEYFQLVPVNFNPIKSNNLSITIQPNPCGDNCTINLDGNESNIEQVRIELYNTKGKRIENGILFNQSNNNKSFRFNPANNLPSGVYIIKFFVGNKSQSSKLIIN